MLSDTAAPFHLSHDNACWKAQFHTMASPCELLIRCPAEREARHLVSLAVLETLRIEHKFSRYRDDNIIHAINHAGGRPVDIDSETSRMLTYAGACFKLSEGLFDITSGILRKAWRFDGQPAVPDAKLVAALRKRVGWNRVKLTDTTVTLPEGWRLILGESGKNMQWTVQPIWCMGNRVCQ